MVWCWRRFMEDISETENNKKKWQVKPKAPGSNVAVYNVLCGFIHLVGGILGVKPVC